MDSKLKCVFILPEDNNVVNGSAYTTAKNEESAVKTSVQASPKVYSTFHSIIQQELLSQFLHFYVKMGFSRVGNPKLRLDASGIRNYDSWVGYWL
jgi:hypothetical protein